MLKAERFGAVLLGLQLLWFAWQQTGASRYFCWAPMHEHVWYQVLAERDGARVADEELAERYGRRGAFHDARRSEFWELNAAQHVIDSITWREATLPPAQRLRVTLTYRINDRGPHTWTYAP
jgi:hypothetical protein